LFEKTNAFCTAQTIKSSPSAAVGCGNEVIDENEACDKGANNGIVCVPGYNKPCTYCSADCKNTITVNPKEYCGNGIIESNEKCDVDEKGNIYYFTTTTGTNIESLGTSSEPDNKNSGYKVSSCAEEYNTKLNKGSIIEFNKKSWVSLTLSKKGEKSCINNCSLLQNKCVECGLDEKAGAGVTINLINVVSSDNPLQIGDDKNGKTLEGNVGLFFVSPQLDLDIDPTYLFKNKHRVAFSYSSDKTSKQRVLHPANYTDSSDTSVAKINSDPICSAFSSDADYRYRLAINADTKQNHMLDFPISATPATGQYDLVLSPVFKDSKQIRIVISWVGNADFDGGFLVNDNGTVKYIEGATGGVAKSESYDYAVKPPSYGFWYHKLKDPGLKDPGFATKAESFTLDVSKMTVSSTQYAFYVKSEGNTAINKFKNTAKLKVEVYFADTDIDVRHFSRPTATYYLSNAIPSDNPAAFYWHVFNVPKSTGNTPVSIDNLTQINLMRTDILFDYSTIYQKP
jgi:hypothetical protein